MDSERKKTLQRIVAAALDRSSTGSTRARLEANEFSNAASTSKSSSGDRESTELHAALNEARHKRLQLLHTSLDATTDEVSETVSPICYVEIEQGIGKDRDTLTFYFTNTMVDLHGITLVTPESPIGKAIQGKKQGDIIPDKKIKILKVE